MQHGDISNKMANTIVIDMNILFKVQNDTLIQKVRELIRVPKFTLKDPFTPKRLEYLFYKKDLIIYLVDRNKTEVRPEKLVEDMSYSRYLHITDEAELKGIIEQAQVILAVFEEDYPIMQIAGFKGMVFTEWHELFREVG